VRVSSATSCGSAARTPKRRPGHPALYQELARQNPGKQELAEYIAQNRQRRQQLEAKQRTNP
jgi:hypothetical protein